MDSSVNIQTNPNDNHFVIDFEGINVNIQNESHNRIDAFVQTEVNFNIRMISNN